MRLAALLTLLLCPVYSATASHQDGTSAWNGQTTPGSDTTQLDKTPFTPYWVPFGFHSIDDSDPTIHYSPAEAWSASSCEGCIGGSEHTSTIPGAKVTYNFQGTGIDWYGTKSDKSGMGRVWLDGQEKAKVDTYSQSRQSQQMLFHVEHLPAGEHVMEIEVLDEANTSSKGHQISVDAFVVQERAVKRTRSLNLGTGKMRKERRLARGGKRLDQDNWTLATTGNSGISAMQLAVIDDNRVLLVDKVEHNLLTVSGHPAWGALYDFRTNKVRQALDLASNSFCAGGSFLSNGTLINIGGNPVSSDHTGAADFGDVNGLQAIRIFDPCEEGRDDCEIIEDPKRIRMASPRWYSTAARLGDGSAFIMGGAIKGGWQNNKTANNPTIEYYPPKNTHGSNGLPIPSPFLVDTLNANLFPIIFYLPDDTLFVAANTQAMIYDWKSNTERRLPDIPNGVRVTYPMAAGAVMLPLTPANRYTPEILICGGSTSDDTLASYDHTSQEPASDQCVRMLLDEEGIDAGWQVERMPEARLMPDLVLLPTGDVLIVNGAGSGVGGYGNVKDQVGQSNAANPVFTPTLYRPSAPRGNRFSTQGMPTSDIARLYHSVASLVPTGEIMIAGSNPNLDRTVVEYPTEYRVETLSPPYMKQQRPSYSGTPSNIEYGRTFRLSVSLPDNTKAEDIAIALIDLGFVTHSVHMNSRLVDLQLQTLTGSSEVIISGPPSAQVYPPGPAWLFLLVKGVPSEGRKVMVGDGSGPPVDEEAVENVLSQTKALAKDHNRDKYPDTKVWGTVTTVPRSVRGLDNKDKTGGSET